MNGITGILVRDALVHALLFVVLETLVLLS